MDLTDRISEIRERVERLKDARVRLDAKISDLQQHLSACETMVEDEKSNSTIYKTEQLALQKADSAAACLQKFTHITNRTVRKTSSIEEKYQLFVSLFAGRPDVHAKRFYSVKQGKSGYSPVCRNLFKRAYCPRGVPGAGKQSCAKCEWSDFSTISMEEFEKHLRGKKEDCSDVLGAYPMDSDEMCTFIVADFDNENRKKEDAALIGDNGTFESMKTAAVSFRKVCCDEGIPAYLERSRSGKGFHVWLFFFERISTKMARRLCTVLLTSAMNKYPGVRFNSYDRLIPNQDSLPENGFGNLIALPLQGRAGREHNSVFLSDDLEVFDDQWTFLSEIRRVTAEEVEIVLRRLGQFDELGALLPNDDGEADVKPWDKKKPAEKLVESDFSGPIKIVRANMIHVSKEGLSQKAINAIKRLAAFNNPEYYKARAMRLSTWDKPRIISSAEETQRFVSLPRGAEDVLIQLIIAAGGSYEVEEKRTEGNKLDISFVGSLREEQFPAAEAMLAYDNGVLSATTAFGKTVIGAYLIARRAVNALVLVWTAQLQTQWVDALRTFLEIRNEAPEKFTSKGRRKKVDLIGVYGGSKKNPSGLIDVATIQSLHRAGEVQDFIKDYGLVIVDECHHIPAVSFEAVLKHVNAKYVYGLTATPTRRDGCHVITFLECGPIRYKVDPKTQAEKRPFGHYIIPRFTRLLPTSIHEDAGMAILLNDVASDIKRNEMIVSDIWKVLEEERNPIVLTERTEHVSVLVEMLSEKCNNVIKLVGGMSTKEKREVNARLSALGNGEKFVIVATGKYIGEGFDFPRLDTLFLALPISWKGKVAQYTGRLHRLYQGKRDVIVYDYVDVNIPVLERMYYKRIKGYKAVGYKTVIREQDEFSLNVIYGKDEYLGIFQADCAAAKKEVVISSPNLRIGKVIDLLQSLSGKLIDDVIVTVFTKSAGANREEAQSKMMACIERLKASSICVKEKEELHARFAVIDRNIVWYGSINLIGYAGSDDNSMRLRDADVAAALLEQLHQDRDDESEEFTSSQIDFSQL
jgi:superfamily II DNA or RNA helicase